MHPVIYLNKTMVEATKARVAPVSSAMLYGRGVFTTLAIYNSQPFLWTKHWQRLTTHAKRLDIDFTGCNEKNVGDALITVSYTHLRAHETGRNLVCRLL